MTYIVKHVSATARNLFKLQTRVKNPFSAIRRRFINRILVRKLDDSKPCSHYCTHKTKPMMTKK